MINGNSLSITKDYQESSIIFLNILRLGQVLAAPGAKICQGLKGESLWCVPFHLESCDIYNSVKDSGYKKQSSKNRTSQQCSFWAKEGGELKLAKKGSPLFNFSSFPFSLRSMPWQWTAAGVVKVFRGLSKYFQSQVPNVGRVSWRGCLQRWWSRGSNSWLIELLTGQKALFIHCFNSNMRFWKPGVTKIFSNSCRKRKSEVLEAW